MKSLPDRNSDEFPEVLKSARIAKKLSYSELAKAVGIHAVMPSRYENREHKDFTAPSQKTWEKLNYVLTSKDLVEINPLGDFSLDQLVDEIKRRGATSVQISF